MLLTRKSTSAVNKDSAAPGRLARSVSGMLGKTIDRRTFLQRSGITLGAGAVISQLPFNIVDRSEAAQEPGVGKIEIKRTVCTHCSVRCALDAVLHNGVSMRPHPA